MKHLEVSGAVRHIYIYVIRRLKVKAVEARIQNTQNFTAVGYLVCRELLDYV